MIISSAAINGKILSAQSIGLFLIPTPNHWPEGGELIK